MLVLISIISISAVSAVDDSNNTDINVLKTTDELSVDSVAMDDELDESNVISGNDEGSVDDKLSDPIASLGDDEQNNEYVIYIGQNTTEGGGNGSIDNPYNDLKAAFDSVSKLGTATNIVNVTVNIFGGDYYLTSKAITSNKYTNYVIQSMPNEKVNIYGTKTITFTTDVVSSTVSTKINGIVFNSPLAFGNHMGHVELSNCVVNTSGTFYFAQLLTKTATDPSRNFVNCTFIGQNKILSSANSLKPYRSVINVTNCSFINISSIELRDSYVLINKCIFNNIGAIATGLASPDMGDYLDYFKFNMTNSIISSSTTIEIACSGTNSNFYIENNWWGANNITDVVNFNNQYYPVNVPSTYAIFNTSSNYLGNNQWEIIGKLTWMDGTTEGIKNFAPMNVLLSSETGIFDDENPVLKDGTFKVIYTGESSNITATLDREVQVLNLTKKVEFNDISNVLSADSSTETIPKFTITLPANATGNLTVFVNNKTYTKELVNGSATLEISDLVVGSYDVVVTYSGDENYLGFTQNSTLTIKEPVKPVTPNNQNSTTTKKTTKKASKIVAKKKTFKRSKKVKKYTITLKSGKKPIKKVKVTLKIKGKTYKATTNSKGKATFKLTKLKKKGKYTAVIKFKGNKIYKATTKKIKITIKK